MSTSSKPTRQVRIAGASRLLMAIYAVLLAVVLFAPSSQVQASLVVEVERLLRSFLPDTWITFTRVEVGLNAVIIAPLTFLGSIGWSRSRWQDWTAYGFMGAVTVELLQGVLLPARQASFSDIVANTAGACFGALLWRLLRALR